MTDQPHDLTDLYSGFPAGFFERADQSSDSNFYAAPRLVTHIDDGAIEAVGKLYTELGLTGRVLDLMGSWVSHFPVKPEELVVLGMNTEELSANKDADSWLQHDLNVNPTMPLLDEEFDGVVCCVSVDYLTRPLEVFNEVHRCLKPGGVFVHTFSNRCFPTKAINGWNQTDDRGHVSIVGEYFRRTGPWSDLSAELRTETSSFGDPLYAVWGRKSS